MPFPATETAKLLLVAPDGPPVTDAYRLLAGDAYSFSMPGGDGLVPRPPDRMRPAQIGAVMRGRVIIGDIAVTLVDLAVRRLLEVEDCRSPEDNWLLIARHAGGPAHRSESMLSYERTLLRALTHDGAQATISALAPRAPGFLAHTRDQIVRDAVRNGWLHRLHHDQRTEEGDQQASRIRVFQHRLREFATTQGEDALTGSLLPYALHFGMVTKADLPLVRFARGWVTRFSALPGWQRPELKARDPLGPVPMNNPGTSSYGYWPTC
jgi:hypothetical protein